jgi:hypothetical protein
LTTQLFFPAPEGLPVAIRPPRGSDELLKILEDFDWHSLSKTRSGDVFRAGALWLHGFLDQSHAVSQKIDSPEGSYWHALMHRSEGDFSNSKYWYRRVGRHPIFPELLAAGRQFGTGSQSAVSDLLRSSNWDPFRFVDILEHVAAHRDDDASLLQALAREEYSLLMGYCLRTL